MAGSASNLAAVILAAGRGSRMAAGAGDGDGDGAPVKMLAPIAGRPMLLHVVEAARAAGLCPLIVVTGHAAGTVEAALAGQPVTIIRNPSAAEGMATSLRAGLGAVPPQSDGAMVLLGDMPGVTAEHLRRLSRAFTESGGTAIIAPTCGGRRGNPVTWPRALFGDLSRVEGDQGGRGVLRRHADKLVPVPLDDCRDGGEGVLRDLDTAEDLRDWIRDSG